MLRCISTEGSLFYIPFDNRFYADKHRLPVTYRAVTGVA